MDDNRVVQDVGKSSDECADTNYKCPEWKTYGYCTKPGFKTKMQKECRKTCDLCSEYCRDVEANKCKGWNNLGYCDNPLPTVRNLMKKYCSKTCGYCQKAAASKCAISNGSPYGCCWDGTVKADEIGSNCKVCKDAEKYSSHICRLFKSSCDNGGMTESWLARYCPKTCALCGHEGECIDREQKLCGKWDERGYCDHRNVDVKNRMIKYCAKTCGFCNAIEIKRK